MPDMFPALVQSGKKSTGKLERVLTQSESRHKWRSLAEERAKISNHRVFSDEMNKLGWGLTTDWTTVLHSVYWSIKLNCDQVGQKGGGFSLRGYGERETIMQNGRQIGE